MVQIPSVKYYVLTGTISRLDCEFFHSPGVDIPEGTVCVLLREMPTPYIYFEVEGRPFIAQIPSGAIQPFNPEQDSPKADGGAVESEGELKGGRCAP